MTDPVGIHSVLDQAARDDLAVRNLDLVARVVGRLPITPPPGVDRNDLLSAGTIGLLNAARTYQPMRGASFRTFAYLTIKSAILDELRRHDPLPRGMRTKLKDLERHQNDARATLGRLPTPDELAASMHLETEDIESLLQLAKESRLLRLDEDAADDSDGGTHFDPADPSANEPSEDVARAEQLAQIEEAIRGLAPRERQVFVLYYSENLYLKEIGVLLGVTESRVCQILACAESKIRARVHHESKEQR
jgi:RNA polymerase sigma factor FliA